MVDRLNFNKFFIYSLLFVLSNSIYAQKKEVKNLIAVKYDNDIFVGIDRYYSFGNFLDYRRVLYSDFILKKRKGDRLQLNFSFGQQGFTPEEFDQADTSLYDYTNAGWLFLETEIARFDKKNGLQLAVEIGLTGEASLAGTVQIQIHKNLNVGNTPLWIDEIPTSFLVNFKAGYIKSIFSYKKYLHIDSLSNAVVGLKDLFVDQELLLSFGSRLDLDQTTLFNNISVQNEIYGYVGIAYKYVAYNHLLEGSLFNDDAPFTIEIENQILRLRAGVGFQLNRNGIKLEHNFNSAENVLSQSHSFTSIIYERNF